MLRASIMNSLCRLHENAGGFLFLPFLPSFHWMPPQSLLISIESFAIVIIFVCRFCGGFISKNDL